MFSNKAAMFATASWFRLVIRLSSQQTVVSVRAKVSLLPDNSNNKDLGGEGRGVGRGEVELAVQFHTHQNLCGTGGGSMENAELQ